MNYEWLRVLARVVVWTCLGGIYTALVGGLLGYGVAWLFGLHLPLLMEHDDADITDLRPIVCGYASVIGVYFGGGLGAVMFYRLSAFYDAGRGVLQIPLGLIVWGMVRGTGISMLLAGVGELVYDLGSHSSFLTGAGLLCAAFGGPVGMLWGQWVGFARTEFRLKKASYLHRQALLEGLWKESSAASSSGCA